MKSTRLLVVVLLMGMCVASWVHLLAGIAATSGSVNSFTEQAEEYRSRKLYELSMESYRKAIEVQESKYLYEELLAAADDYYAESHTSIVRNIVINAYADATAAYPKEASFWERYAQIYIDAESKSSAVRVLQNARNNHVSSEVLTDQWNKIYYAVQTRFEHYESLLTDGNHGFIAENDGLWGSLAADGSRKIETIYSVVSPVGENGEVLCVDEKGENYLFDGNGKMIGRFFADIEECRAYGNGLIPVKISGRRDWCYLNELGEEQFGGFLHAGMFQGGHAAVQLGSGDWCLIGTDGQQDSNSTWQEVCLNNSGAYLIDGRVLLKVDGVWGVYDAKGNEQGDLNADDIDMSWGEYIAFKRGKQWGFADKKGNVVIEPSFDAARSFSGGIGAVCKDGLWGFVNEEGYLVLPYQFADVSYFNASGYCPVSLAEDEGQWRLAKWSVNH